MNTINNTRQIRWYVDVSVFSKWPWYIIQYLNQIEPAIFDRDVTRYENKTNILWKKDLNNRRSLILWNKIVSSFISKC